MEERDMLMQTIESLNASIQTLSESHKKEVESLNARIKELTAQVAWLNRQLFGRKSEKLPVIDPSQLDLFAGMLPENAQQIADAHDEAVEKIIKTTARAGAGDPHTGQSRQESLQEDWRGGDTCRGAQTRPAVHQGNHPREVGAEGQHVDRPQGHGRCADCSHAPAAYL